MSLPPTSIRAKLQIALDASPDRVYVIDAATVNVIDVKALGVLAFLTKPVHIARMRAVIKSLITLSTANALHGEQNGSARSQ